MDHSKPVVKVDRRIRWHYTTTILRLRIGARFTRYRNCKFHNFARTISRHADGISRYSVPPSAGPLLPCSKLYISLWDELWDTSISSFNDHPPPYLHSLISVCSPCSSSLSLVNLRCPLYEQPIVRFSVPYCFLSGTVSSEHIAFSFYFFPLFFSSLAPCARLRWLESVFEHIIILK